MTSVNAMEDESCNDTHYFVEHQQVFDLIQKLICTKHLTSEGTINHEFLAVHSTIIRILDRYLEQSNLLDPYFHEILDPIIKEILYLLATSTILSRPPHTTNDPVLSSSQVSHDPRLDKFFQLVYQLCKLRGYKTILKYLPHDVIHFEPILQLLQTQDSSDYTTWETRYVVLLWLSILCLVPFDLNTIDSSTCYTHMNDVSDKNSMPIVSSIMTLCLKYFEDSGPTQIAAAVCLSRLLSRPDMEHYYLIQFLTWSNQELLLASENTDMRVLQFKVTGIMLCLAHIAKNSPRKQHIEASRIYFASVMRLVAHLTEGNARLDRPKSSTLHCKLSIKLVQRLGLLHLPPKVRSWRYSRGLRSLELTLQSSGLAESNVVISTSQTCHADKTNKDNDDDALEVVEELEQIVEVLLCGLRDRDTVVRWSAAKGIGRITGRLPYEFADDIVQSVLEFFVATEDNGAWHGASLALAELARRGVLIPQRLPEAVECVANALKYDIRKGTYSIGSHVRDAACYACWSFARAYEPSLLLPWLKQVLAPAMLVNCVFDRELNCRRAASAAFQENVGRQGSTNFPSGIDLLTKADYFSVANVRHAYLDVSVFVAKYPEYRYPLLEHLISSKIGHWDVQIRGLAAAALGKIGALDPPNAMIHLFPRLLEFSLSPDVEVIVRHGAVISIADLLMCLSQVPVYIDGELQKKIKMLPIEVDRRRLFRGRGGEMIRSAICNVIEVISISRFSLGFAHVKKYLAMLEECFVHPNESVREAAIDAFGAFTAYYCPKIYEKGSPLHVKYMQELIPRFINSGIMVASKENDDSVKVLNPNVAARRGFLRAVGVAAKELIQPCLKEAFAAIFRSILLQERATEDEDPGSRVAAVQALVDLSSRPPAELDLDGIEDDVIQTLVRCIHNDYRLDERGDVGSWVRKESMIGIEKLLLGETTHTRKHNLWPVGAVVQTKYGRGVIIDSLSARKRKTDEVGNASEFGPVCYVKFDKPAFGYYYFGPTGVGLLHVAEEAVQSSDTGTVCIAAHTRSEQASSTAFARRLSLNTVVAIFGALAKQLAEKLDNIRMTSGGILFRLLHSTSPRIDNIPNRSELEEILPATLTVNWSVAHDTFPLVVKMMDIPDFLEEITAGLVISVGGLTESVVKASKSALFVWVRAHLQSKDYNLLSRFSFFLVTLLTHHHQDDRVTIPLMKTMALLLESNLLRFLFDIRQTDDGNRTTTAGFGGRLYDALRDEIQRCASISKLSAAISVLVGLLPSDPETESKTLRALVLFLGHKFPKVRKLTAERLYTRLLLHDKIVHEDKSDNVVEILSDTAWDASIPQVRIAQNELAKLFGMELRRSKEGRIAPAESAIATQEEPTYKTLIKEMGY